MKQKKALYKEDRLFHLLTWAGWILLAFFVGFLATAILHLARVRRFRNDYAASTAYAQQNLSLTASLDGAEPQALRGGEPDTLYYLLINQHLRSGAYPEEKQSELLFSFGDGAELALCLANDGQLGLRFTSQRGKTSSFLIDMTSAGRYWFGILNAIDVEAA